MWTVLRTRNDYSPSRSTLSARHRRRIRTDASVGRAVGVFPVVLRHNAVDLPPGCVGPDVTSDSPQSCQRPELKVRLGLSQNRLALVRDGDIDTHSPRCGVDPRDLRSMERSAPSTASTTTGRVKRVSYEITPLGSPTQSTMACKAIPAVSIPCARTPGNPAAVAIASLKWIGFMSPEAPA